MPTLPLRRSARPRLDTHVRHRGRVRNLGGHRRCRRPGLRRPQDSCLRRRRPRRPIPSRTSISGPQSPTPSRRRASPPARLPLLRRAAASEFLRRLAGRGHRHPLRAAQPCRSGSDQAGGGDMDLIALATRLRAHGPVAAHDYLLRSQAQRRERQGRTAVRADGLARRAGRHPRYRPSRGRPSRLRARALDIDDRLFIRCPRPQPNATTGIAAIR